MAYIDIVTVGTADGQIPNWDTTTKKYLPSTTVLGDYIVGVNTSKITVSTTAPLAPNTGDLWVDSST